MGADMFGELSGVERMLDFHVARHSVLASNLANADTPGYEAQDLTFSGMLGDVANMQATQAGHFGANAEAAGESALGELAPSPSIDGNGVQVEHTLAQVTANRLRYEQGLELAKSRMALLRYAATDGSGG